MTGLTPVGPGLLPEIATVGRVAEVLVAIAGSAALAGGGRRTMWSTRREPDCDHLYASRLGGGIPSGPEPYARAARSCSPSLGRALHTLYRIAAPSTPPRSRLRAMK